MTYIERKLMFIEAVKRLGEQYQVGVIGTCDNEGIYGEITVVDLEDRAKCHPGDLENLWNFQ